MSEIGDGMDHLRIPFEKLKFGNKLESHGYGTVLEGEFGDQQVALKQLNITNLGNIKPKLLHEILTISRFRQHPNLVALLGFCDERSNEIILVYEYAPSGNLSDKMRKRLNTIQRFEICLGAARGLDYLHSGVDSTTPGIVHGHVKLSKILLKSDLDSSKFEAKVSSFGLSKIVPGKAQLDPEDEVNEKPTKESDVYNFGVLLLEVLCGVSELVDTDDYQERHVSELVPKRLEQDKLRKIVHFDIRREIKSEALETYAKIACQCVIENPNARPTMTQVVEELEKALRLQGGEVTYVQIAGSENINGEIITVDSKTVDEEPQEAEIGVVEEDAKEANSDVAGEDHGEEISIAGKSSEYGEKDSEDDITVQERSFDASVLDIVNGNSLTDSSHTEDPQNESSTNDQLATEEITEDLSSKEESNITEDDHHNKIDIEVTQRDITSTNDPETTEEIINSSNSIEESHTNEDDNQSKSQTEDTKNESGDAVILSPNDPETTEVNTNDSNSEQESNSEVLQSGNEVGDELDDLRIPFQKIKFGKKIDINGYGSMFEGEYNNEQVALKQLNITNLGNIKPKLLSEILNVARFRNHPNLVALIGFCDEKTNEIIIVYEYIAGGNLQVNLSKHLTTIQRLEICLGAALGVDYLHNGLNPALGIIHGDIKLSKILLDLDSDSLRFVAKVSSFGLSKLIPGNSQTIIDREDKTKESDVYYFGVLLLEVLCGVTELVDTDDYQERHVTELVPKRLEQNMLRKIVHFDIRDEIRTEVLETYAKIASQCVVESPEERPTMGRVVEELEKALELQGEQVTDIEVLGGSNGNGLPEENVDEDDNGETVSFNTEVEESKVIEEPVDDIALEAQSFPVDSVPDITYVKEADKMSDKHTDDSEIIQETIADVQSSEESNIILENELENESKIPLISLESNNGDIEKVEQENCDIEKAEQENGDIEKAEKENGDIEKAVQENGSTLPTSTEKVVHENGNTLPTSTNEQESKEEEIMDEKITPMEITTEAHNSEEHADSKVKLHSTKNETEPIISTREINFTDFDTTNLISVDKKEESKTKRSNSTSSESSNGDGNTPTDSLLQKSSPNGTTTKKTSYGSRSCCSCSWWNIVSNSLTMLQSCFVRRAILE